MQLNSRKYLLLIIGRCLGVDVTGYFQLIGVEVVLCDNYLLPSREIVALLPVGSLFFAGAAEFEERLPEVGDAQRSVVIIGLRDRDEIGSTFVRIIERYAKQLDATGNKLILAGMNERILKQLEETELMKLLGEEDIFGAEAEYFGPLKKALTAANNWIEEE